MIFNAIKVLCDEASRKVGFDERWDDFKGWLKRDRNGSLFLAFSLIGLSIIILLFYWWTQQPDI